MSNSQELSVIGQFAESLEALEIDYANTASPVTARYLFVITACAHERLLFFFRHFRFFGFFGLFDFIRVVGGILPGAVRGEQL